MNKKIRELTSSLLLEKHRYSKWKKVVSVLAAVVVFSTTYALILPALTVEGKTYCGLKEHTHTEECYVKKLTCDKEEKEGHTHTEDCYTQILTCDKEEHIHSTICYSNPKADVETAKDWEKTIPSKLTGNCEENLVAVAKSQLNYKESTDNYNVETKDEKEIKMGYTRYGQWYGKPYAEWNTLFVDFCLHYANVPENTIPQVEKAEDWITQLNKQYEAAKKKDDKTVNVYQSAKDYTPEAGDLVFLNTDGDKKADQAGIIEKVNLNGKNKVESITVIAGDMDAGSSADAVAEKTYKITDTNIIGYAHLQKSDGNTKDDADSKKDNAVENTETSSEENKTESSSEENKTESSTEEMTTETMPEEEKETTKKTFENTEIKIVASYQADAQIPENAEFVVNKIDSNKQLKQYESQKKEAIQVVKENQDEVGTSEKADTSSSDFKFLLYDISFQVDGEEIEPKAAVDMKFELQNQSAKQTNYQVVHFAEDGTKVVEDQKTKKKEDGTVTIDMTVESFSEYGVLSYVDSGVDLTATSNTSDNTFVKVNKEWEDGNENHKNDSVKVHLYKTLVDDNGDTLEYSSSTKYYDSTKTSTLQEKMDTGKTVTLNAQNNWTATFEDLPATETYYQYTYCYISGYGYGYGYAGPYNAKVEYQVEEEKVPDGYTSLVTQNKDSETNKTWKQATSISGLASVNSNNSSCVIVSSDGKYALVCNQMQSKLILKPVSITGNSTSGYQITSNGKDVPLYMIWKSAYEGDYNSTETWSFRNQENLNYLAAYRSGSTTVFTDYNYRDATATYTSYGYTYYSYTYGSNFNVNFYSSGYATINLCTSRYLSYSTSDKTVFSDSSSSYWKIYYLDSKTTGHSYTITNYKTDSGEADYQNMKLEHHKTIDALRDNQKLNQDNSDTVLDDAGSTTDLTDLYRLNLDITGVPTPIDVLFVMDQSNSMATADMSGNTRISELLKFLNGTTTDTTVGSDGFINKFLEINQYNRYAIIGFGGDTNILSADDGYTYEDDTEERVSWGRSTNTVSFDADMGGTNYDAALKKASDMFEKIGTTSGEAGDTIPHKRMMIFLSDGVPSYYIDIDGNRGGNTITNLNTDNAKVCGASAKIQFNEFLRENQDVQTFTVAFYGTGSGGDFDTSVLEYMAKGGGGVYKYADSGQALLEFLQGICMPNKVTVTDTLSDYVEYYEEKPELKVIATHKTTGYKTTLYDDRYTTPNRYPGIVKNVSVDGKTIKLEFIDSYCLESDWTYTLSFNVKTTQEAYNEFAQNAADGKDGYDGIKGDKGTDYGDNQTSSEKAGFYSNSEAIVEYTLDGFSRNDVYIKPVIQVADCAFNIKKVSMASPDVTLQGAEFDLYRKAQTGETGTSLEGLEGKYVKVNTKALVTNEKGMIEGQNLTPNTYYLVETKAPADYEKLEEPLTFTLNRATVTTPSGNSYITGQTVTSGIPVLTVKNKAAESFALPNTGGIGTHWYLLAGMLLMLSSVNIYILIFKRREGER
jgi:LPXTG-motif cell wall-anchored protein